MSKTWRLTPQAEQSMFEIAQWTFQTFGPRQADAYEQDILDRLDTIVVGIAHNRSCQSLLDKKTERDVRYTHVGSHYLIYAEYDEHFVLLDVLHQRVDLPRRLAHIASKAKS
jgi:toxin ParE1/3/4